MKLNGYEMRFLVMRKRQKVSDRWAILRATADTYMRLKPPIVSFYICQFESSFINYLLLTEQEVCMGES